MKRTFHTLQEARGAAQVGDEIWARDSRGGVAGWCLMTTAEAEEYIRTEPFKLWSHWETIKAPEPAPVLVKRPHLAEDEVYVGVIGDASGNLHHIILLPGDNDDATHDAQIEWAKSIGGDLPTRIEQAMLWANHRDQFKKDWYWSNEIHHAESGWAWYQGFNYGGQHDGTRHNDLRARAVRRVPITKE